MANRRHTARCVKRLRTYNVREAAKATGATSGTVRQWQKCGLEAVEGHYPLIFRGVDLIVPEAPRGGTEAALRAWTHILPSLQGTESARLWRSRVSAGRDQARDALGVMPGLRRVHEPPHLLGQAEGGGRRFEGFNAVR